MVQSLDFSSQTGHIKGIIDISSFVLCGFMSLAYFTSAEVELNCFPVPEQPLDMQGKK